MVVPRNGTVRAGWEPVALMDGKQFKSLDEAFDDMRAVAKLPRSEQPEWYRKQFSEVLNTGSLRKVGKGEYAARQVGEAIKSRPRVVALTAGGTLAAGAAAKNELDRQKKNAFAE